MAYSVPNLHVLRVQDRFAPAARAASALEVRRVAELAHALASIGRSLQGFRQLLRAPSDPLRVLVVTDSPRRRALLHAALRPEHELVDASSYADALVLLATEVVDAVVVEARIGGVGSGASLLAEVRARWPLLRRVLICSSLRAAQPLAQALLEAGTAHRVLAQPLDQEVLLASLRAELPPWYASGERGTSSAKR